MVAGDMLVHKCANCGTPCFSNRSMEGVDYSRSWSETHGEEVVNERSR